MTRARLILAVLIAGFVSWRPAMAASLDELTRAWPPATFAYKLDSKLAVSAAIIAAKGGELTATGEDGTVYRLVIPASALLLDETITMTPFASATGLPGQTSVHGVDLQPAGLELMDSADLTISLRADDSGRLSAFHGTGESGTAAVRAALIGGSITKLVLFHFSAAGVASGDASTAAAIAPADPSLDTQFNAMNGLTPPTPGSPNFLPALQSYIEAQVGRLLQLAANGTYSHDRAWENINGWEEIADELALLLAKQTTKTAEAGLMTDSPAVEEATFYLLKQARMNDQLENPQAAETIRRQLGDLLTTYAANLGATCARQKIDEIPVLQLVRHLQMLSLDTSNELSARLMRCLEHRMVATFKSTGANGSTYEFSHCGSGEKGDWDLKVEGWLSGDGKGNIGDDETGTWSESLSNSDMAVSANGRLVYVPGDAPKLRVIGDGGTATVQGHTVSMPRTGEVVWPVKTSEGSCAGAH